MISLSIPDDRPLPLRSVVRFMGRELEIVARSFTRPMLYDLRSGRDIVRDVTRGAFDVVRKPS